jgi:hypothetical protein
LAAATTPANLYVVATEVMVFCGLAEGALMKRREFIILLGSAAEAWPLTARAHSFAIGAVSVVFAQIP